MIRAACSYRVDFIAIINKYLTQYLLFARYQLLVSITLFFHKFAFYSKTNHRLTKRIAVEGKY